VQQQWRQLGQQQRGWQGLRWALWAQPFQQQQQQQ
jgi:hypothetical protein